MQKSGSNRSAVQADAVVRRVDTLNRELTAVDGETVLVFDVPPDCPVVLRGERVKLRLIQSRDRVRVTYDRTGNALTARSIEVRPGCAGASLCG
ncbi:MAG TPA: hypothetical protein VM533_21760 [Fimbriiglobus sp.]|jgi:hypothetical protein|nr:hypothetical protein [Fimbriiglobus sp.]